MTDGDRGIEEMRIIGIMDDVKKFTHERYLGVYYTPHILERRDLGYAEIVIRSKDHLYPGSFKSTFMKEIAPSLRRGNYYLKELIYIPGVEAESNRNRDSDLLTQLCMIFFLLINVGLCLVGTFWYRVNTRKAEIGLRLAVGSTRKGVVRLLCLEGVALLACVVLPALVVEYQLLALDMTQTWMLKFREPEYRVDNLFIRFLITNAITFLILLAVVTLAVWIPARKAAVLAPAEVLHED
ncbi:MAG: FtsX-like permease family protein [Bacteroides sp.]|nr:FtsX-like permease family protein [Bacteroides sp.]